MVGLIVGLIVSGLLMIPLLLVPGGAAWPAIIFVYLVFGSLGFRLRASPEDGDVMEARLTLSEPGTG